MTRLLLAFGLAAAALFAQTQESAGAPPSDVDPAIAGMVQKDGVRVKNGAKTLMELWFVTKAPTDGNNGQDSVTFQNIAPGSFMGVMRFPERGSDRRGQTIKPGAYTMRLGFYPQNGDHQGVAPQRDFLVLAPISVDKDPKATPAFEAMVDMSRKASGTPHPAVLSLWKVEQANFKPGIAQEGEGDTVLQTKIGDLPAAVVVAGTAAH